VSAPDPHDPGTATGLAGIALRAAVGELLDGQWRDQEQVAKAMAAASTLAVRSCTDYLRKWAHFGLVAVDARYFRQQDGTQVRRRPRVALSTLGRAWLVDQADQSRAA
jgi:hypothetical protein